MDIQRFIKAMVAKPRENAMPNDEKIKVILAANFSDECGDPGANAHKAATDALEALKDEGFIVARDPEHEPADKALILPFRRDVEPVKGRT